MTNIIAFKRLFLNSNMYFFLNLNTNLKVFFNYIYNQKTYNALRKFIASQNETNVFGGNIGGNEKD